MAIQRDMAGVDRAQRHAAVRSRHEGAGMRLGFIVDRRAVRRQYADAAPIPHKANAGKIRKELHCPAGHPAHRRERRAVVVLHVFLRIADLNGAFIGLTYRRNAGRQHRRDALGDQHLAAFRPDRDRKPHHLAEPGRAVPRRQQNLRRSERARHRLGDKGAAVVTDRSDPRFGMVPPAPLRKRGMQRAQHQ